MEILKELRERKILNNITNEEKFNSLSLSDGVYIGFDPTATSLHLGNYIQISILKRFKNAGFKTIAVVGGATGMIGDPSGKSEERNLLGDETLSENKALIRKQLEGFGFDVIDNYDFYKDMNILEFLRDAGKLLNVSYMINKDIVKNRIESGISFTEFSYQLIQGWDFKSLYDNHNVKIQVGGSDQWGNITSGIEMIRKSSTDEVNAVGITTELLTTSSGKKFGKSEGNALFLSEELTSSFEIYQYLINTPDEDVEKLLNWLTFLPVQKIKEIIVEHSKDKKERFAQKTLAINIINDIYGENEFKDNIKVGLDILFGSALVQDLTTDQALSLEGAIPTFASNTKNMLDLLVETKIVSSKREAREFIENGAIEINGQKIKDDTFEIDFDFFDNKATIIKRGKKKFYLIKH